MTLAFVSTLVILVVNALVFILIANQDRNKPATKAFLLSNIFVMLWTLSAGLLLLTKNEPALQLSIQLFCIAPIFLMMSLTMFASNFLISTEKLRFAPDVVALWVLSICFILMSMLDNSLLIKGVIYQETVNIIEVSQAGYFIYFLYFSVAFFITFSHLYKTHQKINGRFQQQIKYVFAGMFASSTLSTITNLVMPLLGISEYIWVGPASTLFYVLTVTISIIRHGLFDIRFAAVRMLAYSLSLSAMASLYFGLAYFLSIFFFKDSATTGISISPVNIFLAFLLAIVFQPLKRFFDRTTNHIFFRDRYDIDEFIKTLGKIHMREKSVHSLLESSAHEISTTLKATSVSVVSYGSEEVRTKEGTAGRHIDITKKLDMIRVVTDDAHEVVLAEDLAGNRLYEKLYDSLRKAGIAILVPLHDTTGPVGLVAIGDHKSSRYSNYDIRALGTIVDELVIAMNNVRSLEKIHLINIGLQQRIDDATRDLTESNKRLMKLDETKDEFMSIASHQLRTPLTSIKGYISMLLEGDLGKLAPAQKKVLEEAFQSSERMVSLIGDFLNMSRLQTGKFSIDREKCQIDEIIDSEVKNLEAVASTRGLKLKLITTRKRLPILYIDEQKIRQTVMNFIDNAIYYSKPGKTITVKLQVIDGSVEFRVIDSGIGVPKEEQAQLFTKFFRATNAHKRRPDGTGVGLFLAKKVIDGHGGSIIFQSEEGKGSTFGFLLPIKKLSEPPEPEEA